MKNRPQWLIILALIFFAAQTWAQTAFYDAKKLKEAGVSGTTPITLPENDAVFAILGNYVKGSGAQPTQDEVKKAFMGNPFIQYPPGSQGSPNAVGMASLLKSVGGLDVTTFADGLGKFLAERTKEEINIAFFEKFKLLLTEYPELGTTFPHTVKYMEVVMNHEYANMLTTLKEAFERDLKSLPRNLIKVGELTPDDCKCQNLIKQNKCKRRIQYISNLYKSQEGNVVVASLLVVDAILSSQSVPATVAAIAENSAIKEGKTDVANVLKLLAIVSNSFRDAGNPDKWVKADDLKALVQDALLFDIYNGLLYQQIKNQQIKIGKVDIWTEIKPANTAGIQTYLTKTIGTTEAVAEGVKKLKEKDTVLAEDVSKYFIGPFRDFFKAATNYSIINPNIPEPTEKTKLVLYVTDQGMEITQNILTKNYAAAVLSSLYMLDTLMETRQYTTRKGAIKSDKIVENNLNPGKEQFSEEVLIGAQSTDEKKEALTRELTFTKKKKNREAISAALAGGDNTKVDNAFKTYVEGKYNTGGSINEKKAADYITEQYLAKQNYKRNLLRYGTFMANVILAKNSDEVKKAIQAVALPPGSASIKKNTNFSITLQAYTGFSGGREVPNLKTPAKQGVFFNVLSVYAPVGVAFNIGLKSHPNPSNKYNAGSLSAMLSIIDVGAIFSYRFNNPSDSLNASVKIRLENIFAPGINIVYGIPKVPLSIGTGIQWQPSLERLKEDKVTINTAPGVRWQLFIAFDLPMLNLYTSKK